MAPSCNLWLPVALLVALAASACTGHDVATRARAQPVTPEAEDEALAPSSASQVVLATSRSSAAPKAAAVKPAAEVEPTGWVRPGRYAVDVHKKLSGTHARNWLSEDSRASFVLNLDANGQADACRGIRTRSSHSGPEVNSFSSTAHQQGYRGRWELKGEWLHVALNVDDGRCGRQQLYENLAPQHWLLRCRKLEAGEHSHYAEPLLACALDNEQEHQYRESFAYFVPEVIAGEWLLLAPGDGLHVEWLDDSVPPAANPSQIALKPAQARVEDDTWTKP